jgi:hypothetical protein
MLTKKLNKNYECFYSLIIILNLSVVVNYNNKSYFEYIASSLIHEGANKMNLAGL